MKYLISYDLRGKNRRDDRRSLDEFLDDWGAERVLESQWAIELDDTTAHEILREIREEDSVRDRDGLLVCAVSARVKVLGNFIRGYAKRRLLPNEIL